MDEQLIQEPMKIENFLEGGNQEMSNIQTLICQDKMTVTLNECLKGLPTI